MIATKFRIYGYIGLTIMGLSLLIMYICIDAKKPRKFTNEYLNGFYSYDKRQVYYRNTPIEGADPATFTHLNHAHYTKDKSHVYYDGQRLNANPEAFHIIDYEGFAADQHNVYFGPTQIQGASTQELRILGNGFIKDQHHVFFIAAAATNCTTHANGASNKQLISIKLHQPMIAAQAWYLASTLGQINSAYAALTATRMQGGLVPGFGTDEAIFSQKRYAKLVRSLHQSVRDLNKQYKTPYKFTQNSAQIIGANPKTFKVFSVFAKDGNMLYYCGYAPDYSPPELNYSSDYYNQLK